MFCNLGIIICIMSYSSRWELRRVYTSWDVIRVDHRSPWHVDCSPLEHGSSNEGLFDQYREEKYK